MKPGDVIAHDAIAMSGIVDIESPSVSVMIELLKQGLLHQLPIPANCHIEIEWRVVVSADGKPPG